MEATVKHAGEVTAKNVRMPRNISHSHSQDEDVPGENVGKEGDISKPRNSRKDVPDENVGEEGDISSAHNSHEDEDDPDEDIGEEGHISSAHNSREDGDAPDEDVGNEGHISSAHNSREDGDAPDEDVGNEGHISSAHNSREDEDDPDENVGKEGDISKPRNSRKDEDDPDEDIGEEGHISSARNSREAPGDTSSDVACSDCFDQMAGPEGTAGVGVSTSNRPEMNHPPADEDVPDEDVGVEGTISRALKSMEATVKHVGEATVKHVRMPPKISHSHSQDEDDPDEDIGEEGHISSAHNSREATAKYVAMPGSITSSSSQVLRLSDLMAVKKGKPHRESKQEKLARTRTRGERLQSARTKPSKKKKNQVSPLTVPSSKSSTDLTTSKQDKPSLDAAPREALTLEELLKLAPPVEDNYETCLPEEEKEEDKLYKAKLADGGGKFVDICRSNSTNERLYILEQKDGKSKLAFAAADVFAAQERLEDPRSDPLLGTQVRTSIDGRDYSGVVVSAAYRRKSGTSRKKLYLVEYKSASGEHSDFHDLWSARQVWHAEELIPLEDELEKEYDPIWQSKVENDVDDGGPPAEFIDVMRSLRSTEKIYILGHTIPGYPGNARFTAKEVAYALNHTAPVSDEELHTDKLIRSELERTINGVSYTGEVMRFVHNRVSNTQWSSQGPRRPKEDNRLPDRLYLVRYKVREDRKHTRIFHDLFTKDEISRQAEDEISRQEWTKEEVNWRCCCGKDGSNVFAVSVHNDLAVGTNGWGKVTSPLLGSSIVGSVCPRLSFQAETAHEFAAVAKDDNMCACTAYYTGWKNEEKCNKDKEGIKHTLSYQKVPDDLDGARAFNDKCSSLCSWQWRLPKVKEECRAP